MKAITLTQPWATLVALGAKRIETRGWACYYTGPLAIHAAKGYKKREYASLLQNLFFHQALNPSDDVHRDPLAVRGCVIAITSVVRCIALAGNGYPHGADSVWIPYFTEKERAFGNFLSAPGERGRFAWILGNVQRIKPVPAVGHQLLWDWESEYEVIA